MPEPVVVLCPPEPIPVVLVAEDTPSRPESELPPSDSDPPLPASETPVPEAEPPLPESEPPLPELELDLVVALELLVSPSSALAAVELPEQLAHPRIRLRAANLL
jgi:hypothetical protein